MTRRRKPDPDPRAREPAQPTPNPPTELTTIICQACGGHYLDIPIGHDSHKVVMGHQPVPPPTTNPREDQ